MDTSSTTENGADRAPGGDHVNIVIDTLDHQSSAGQGQQVRDVQVVHQPHNNPATGAKTSGGILAAAAASAASTLQSAKEAISGK